jgi:hypothetical protein
MQLSESLYLAFHIFEVNLRNKIHEVASIHFGTDWLVNGNVKFNDFHNNKIQSAMKDLKNKGKPVEIPRIIAELNLGFWTALFDHEYFNDFTTKIVIDSLLNLSKATKKRNLKIRSRFRNIRKLRNRVFHFEPIWNLQPSIRLKYDELIEAISWISTDMEKWLASFSRFDENENNKP